MKNIAIILTNIALIILLLMRSLQVDAKSEDTYICEEYQDYVEEISSDYGICPELILAIIEHESHGQADINNNNGCYGLMQINKSSHTKRMKKLGVTDLYDPYSNILVGVDYIVELSEEYEDVASVLMHYHGENNIESKLDNGKLSKYAQGILDRSHELEMIRYGE